MKKYFSKISKSNLLLLASNFDNYSIEYYKYSWPAKLGSYLMSKVQFLFMDLIKYILLMMQKKMGLC